MTKITTIKRTAKNKVVLMIDDKQITVVQCDNKPKRGKDKVVYPYEIKGPVL